MRGRRTSYTTRFECGTLLLQEGGPPAGRWFREPRCNTRKPLLVFSFLVSLTKSMSPVGRPANFKDAARRAPLPALACAISVLIVLLPAATRAAGLGLVMNWTQAQGKEIGLPGGVASLLKLSDAKSDWLCRTEAYEGDDNSQHYFSVGMKKKGVVIAYKPGKSTYVLNWLTDE